MWLDKACLLLAVLACFWSMTDGYYDYYDWYPLYNYYYDYYYNYYYTYYYSSNDASAMAPSIAWILSGMLFSYFLR